jgi:hypothetical protein
MLKCWWFFFGQKVITPLKLLITPGNDSSKNCLTNGIYRGNDFILLRLRKVHIDAKRSNINTLARKSIPVFVAFSPRNQNHESLFPSSLKTNSLIFFFQQLPFSDSGKQEQSFCLMMWINFWNSISRTIWSGFVGMSLLWFLVSG